MNFPSQAHCKLNQANHNIIDSYNFSSYNVSISTIPEKEVTLYNLQYDPITYSHLKNFYTFENEVKALLENYIQKKKEFCTFDQLYSFLSENIHQELDIPSKILIPILLRVLNIEWIGSLLMDDQIDEIYLDSSERSLYVDHSKYGRCSTTILLSKSEIEAFVQRVALENDFSLNQANPTMKSDFVSSLFHTRVTVDIPPLIIDDIHIDIRKFHFHRLRLSDLIRIGSITDKQVAFLIYMIQNLVSVSIIGPPNSGKTTLQNSLIEYIPSHLRLLSVEDVLESAKLRQGNTVRFRLGYDPTESMLFSKSLEIQKILHRSPDFINLGELSTKGHFTAYLNVLSVGIPSIQTIHGKNPEFLFYRLRDIYHIPLELLKTSIPHIFIELDVKWMTENGDIVSITDKEIDLFLSQQYDNSNIFTLKYLQERNCVEFDEIELFRMS
ncbi:MAG: ATPase, T2SS/T4P/T4SS family [Candidatus Hodarchaeales archaeon]|jgi:type IV secretory pathway ATPase VirB11/archaellum biosynthesis ATPase